jgi:hypothetical protein
MTKDALLRECAKRGIGPRNYKSIFAFTILPFVVIMETTNSNVRKSPDQPPRGGPSSKLVQGQGQGLCLNSLEADLLRVGKES